MLLASSRTAQAARRMLPVNVQFYVIKDFAPEVAHKPQHKQIATLSMLSSPLLVSIGVNKHAGRKKNVHSKMICCYLAGSFFVPSGQGVAATVGSCEAVWINESNAQLEYCFENFVCYSKHAVTRLSFF